MTAARIRRLRHSFAALIAGVSAWSAGQLLAAAIPCTVVAAVSAIAFVVAAIHAATIALYLRLIESVGSALRLPLLGRQVAAATTLAAIGLSYWFAAAADGPRRQLAVAGLFLLGLGFYASRNEIRRALRDRLLRVERSG